MKPGTQIVYTPDLERGNLNHKYVEYGFVVEPEGDFFHICHFWSKGKPGRLRTKNRPEKTSNRNLTVKKSVPQKQVDEMMEKLGMK